MGQDPAIAQRAEVERGNSIRVLGLDGKCAAFTDDLDLERVDVIIEDGVIVWAEMG